MQTYILLLRGINVGGKNKLPMKELIPLLECLGYQKVKTYIQTGNIVVQHHTRPSTELTELIAEKFGFSPNLMVLDQAEFETAVANNPFNPEEGKHAHFYFCSSVTQLDLEKATNLCSPTEEYSLRENTFYLHAPDGIGRSKLVANIEKFLGSPATGRNLNTVRKIQEMLESLIV